jgi:hypothetical protein
MVVVDTVIAQRVREFSPIYMENEINKEKVVAQFKKRIESGERVMERRVMMADEEGQQLSHARNAQHRLGQ